MADNTIVLITGANRGIGQGLTKTYLLRPNHTVVATVRSTSDATAQALSSLPTGPSSTLIVLTLDVSSATSTAEALSSLQLTHNVSHLDIVIANAGAQNMTFAPVSTVDPLQVLEHFKVNTLGPLHVFQATWPLLQNAAQPKFVLMGSPLGSIGGIEKRPVPMAAYGASKTAAHYLARKIHVENADLVALVIDPGFVQSESGNQAAVAFGMPEAPVTVQASADFIISSIDKAERRETSGRFLSIGGKDMDW